MDAVRCFPVIRKVIICRIRNQAQSTECGLDTNIIPVMDAILAFWFLQIRTHAGLGLHH
jgi:hypothetical protein